MVNPNDPNSEPDGTPPSDPTPDPNSGDSPDTPSSESGPISDELFDSLSELLGDSDSPATDEPASLPDIELWSDQPAEAASSEPNVGEPSEEPTLPRLDAEVEATSDPDELIPPGPSDTIPIEPSFTAATPGDSLGDASPSQSDEDQVADIWAEDTSEVDLPIDDPSTPDVESPLFAADAGEQSEPLFSDASASDDLTETSSDFWTDQPPEEVSPADPITADEDPTIIQGAPTIIQPDSSADSTPDFFDDPSDVALPREDQPQDLRVDPPAAPIDAESQDVTVESPPETPIPTSESTDPTMAVPPPIGESGSDWAASDDVSVPPEPIPSENINADDPIIEPAASLEVEEASFTDVSTDETSGTPVEGAGSPSGHPPIIPVPTEGASTAESARDRDPDPIPVATGAGSSPRSGIRPASTGDLGPLSGKLPLNRYQSVGLLVAMSTLGTITYLGVTGNNADQSPITPGTATSSPIPESATRANPPSGVAVVPPQPQDRTAPTAQPTLEPETSETPDNQPEAIGAPAAAPIPSKLDISDVPADHWAYPFITKLHAQGVIPDYPDGKFQPDKPATRSEVAAQIQRAFVNESGQRQLAFSDIPTDYWAAEAIEGAVDKKFMSGYPEGDFQPDKLVPRYEVLVALVSGLELNPPSSPESSLQRFQDQGQLPNWSKGKIAASTLGGMVVNHPDPVLLEPEKNATRAEVAAMIHQALVQKGTLEPINSKFVVAPEP